MSLRLTAGMQQISCCRMDFPELKCCEGGGIRAEVTASKIGIETSSLVKIGPKCQVPYYINSYIRYNDYIVG